jgi:hypothetical protein
MTSDLRLALIACAILTFAAAAFCAPEATNQPTRMAIDLIDGSHIVGTPGITGVSFQTPYAKMNIPLEKIRIMKHGDTATTFSLTLANEDKMEGNLSPEKLQLDTLFGPLAVDLKFIKTVRILHGGSSLAGLILHYAFDADDGETVKDATGKNNGTVVGAKWTPDGRIGGGYRVGRNVGYIQVPDSDLWSFEMRPFSICLWFRFDAVPRGEQMFIGQDDGGGARNKWLFGFSNGELYFHTNNESGAGRRIAAHPWSPQVHEWHHFSVTRNGNTYSTYIDGVPVSTSDDPSPVPTSKAALTIGQAEELYVNGAIDEVMIFDRALSADEILQIHDAAK